MSWHRFSYRPLEEAQTQFRLLRLLPGSSHSLECTLSVHELHCPRSQYIAVSYVWGNAIAVETIQINGLQYRIPHNCLIALEQMKRHADFEQCDHFWIDYICINQKDIEERNQQVRLMGDIYANAVYVAACIGESTRFQDFETLLSLGPAPEDRTPADFEPTEKARMRATAALSEREYFVRLWTVRECRFARSIKIYCGSYCLDRDQLLERCSWNSPVIQATLQSCSRPSAIATCVERQPLSVLLRQFADRKCADVRDKLYALLSLADEYEIQHVPVDYGRDLFDILKDLVAALQVRIADRTTNSNEQSLFDTFDSVHNLSKHFSRDTDCFNLLYSHSQSAIDVRLPPHTVRAAIPQEDVHSILMSQVYEIITEDLLPQDPLVPAPTLDLTGDHIRTVVIKGFPMGTTVWEASNLVNHLGYPLVHGRVFENPDESSESLGPVTVTSSGMSAELSYDNLAACKTILRAVHGLMYNRRRLRCEIKELSAPLADVRRVLLHCQACERSAEWLVPGEIEANDLLVPIGTDLALVFQHNLELLPFYKLVAWAEPTKAQNVRSLLPCQHSVRQQKELSLDGGDLLDAALLKRRFSTPFYFRRPKSVIKDERHMPAFDRIGRRLAVSH